MDALRVVVEVQDLEELSLLRKELSLIRKQTTSLHRELDLWRGVVPEVGSHSHLDDDLVMMHGWDFQSLSVAWRYDGEQRSRVTRGDGSNTTLVRHVFTSPLRHANDDSSYGDGWIRVHLETYELHRVWPSDMVASYDGHMLLSSDDHPIQMRNGEYEPMSVLYVC